MYCRLRRNTSRCILAVLLVALGLLGGTIAQAGTVTYSTTGYFNGNGTLTSLTKGTGIHAATLLFSGYSDRVSAPTGAANLGSFFTVLGSASNFSDSFAGTTFTLVITQIDPQIASGSITETIIGVLKHVSGNASSTLDIQWGAQSITLPPRPDRPGATYTPYDTHISAGIGNVQTTLQGAIDYNAATVPLPAAANMALAAFAGMGGLGLWRKWKVSREVLA